MTQGESPTAPGSAPPGITVTPVQTKKDLDAFIKLPWRLYEGDPNWVPPLLFSQRQLFSPEHNAFYRHADVQLFIARRGDEVVGRLSAQVDPEHNRVHNERTGFFGFFESVDDPDVARALLAEAETWLRARGMDRLRGPLSFSTNGEAGVLVDGYAAPPMFLMPYNHPYLPALIEGAGLAKVKDLYAWRWEKQPVPDGPPRRMVQELRKRPGVTVRTARLGDFRAEVDRILGMYNEAWSENWGFVPATVAEAEQMAKDLKLIVDTEIVPFVLVNGEPAGVALAIPNLNEAIRDLNGRLFPFGWAKLLWRLKVRRVKTGRLLLLGIKREFRTREYAGLAYLLCDEIYRGATKRGYEWAEFSWTLEDNGLVNSLIRKVGATHYKTYRIYEKALA